MWLEQTFRTDVNHVECEAGLHQELTRVVEVHVIEDERSRTYEFRGLRRVKSKQLDNTTRLNVQDENADG